MEGTEEEPCFETFVTEDIDTKLHHSYRSGKFSVSILAKLYLTLWKLKGDVWKYDNEIRELEGNCY